MCGGLTRNINVKSKKWRKRTSANWTERVADEEELNTISHIDSG